ncbi:MAG: hypothetical protein SFZ03_06870 [Candidatus Melainabacteria bacterium]|nr:hypothetical protein [Candidatus Melainabacteria bacterium]
MLLIFPAMEAYPEVDSSPVMVNFFHQQAIAQTHPQRMLQAVRAGWDVVGSFPIAFDYGEVYRLASSLLEGVTVVLCPDRLAIDLHLGRLTRMGLCFPSVVALDGRQMPHQVRDIHQRVTRGQPQLLYVTPEVFRSVPFLQLLVHAPVAALVVEEAQFLLPDRAGSFRYASVPNALNLMQHRPPLVLLGRYLGAAHRRLMQQAFALRELQTLFELVPDTVRPMVTVHRRFTRQGKLRALQRLLFPRRDRSQAIRAVEAPQRWLLQARSQAEAQWLMDTLTQWQRHPILLFHSGVEEAERKANLAQFAQEPTAIAVVVGYWGYFFQFPAEINWHMVYWSLPNSLEELVSQAFRAQQGQASPAELHVLHTREDFFRTRRLLGSVQPPTPASRQALEAFNQVRSWLLKDQCRYQTLRLALDQQQYALQFPAQPSVENLDATEALLTTPVIPPPCGLCDGCQTRGLGGIFRPVLNQLLY